MWAKFGATKNGQLGPDNNPSIFGAFFKEHAEPYFYSVLFTKQANFAQGLTLKLATLGPDNSSTACAYINSLPSQQEYMRILLFWDLN